MATVIFNETFNRLSPDYKSEILFASLKRITCFTTERKNDLQGACVPFQWKYLHESTSTVANEISSSRWTSKRATCIFLSQVIVTAKVMKNKNETRQIVFILLR